MQAITYSRARLIVLAIGCALIAGVTLTSFLLGADLVEVAATALLLPVFVVAAYTGPLGGAAAAVGSSAAYISLRLGSLPPGTDTGAFAGSMVTRVAIYLAIGLVGGAAMRQLERSLRKLELYDEVDDETGVGNARAVLSLADKEQSRAQRYGSVFSLGIVEIDHEVFQSLPRKRALKALREFVQDADDAARTSDGVARVQVGDSEQVILVMPETGQEGARVAVDRLLDRARNDFLELGLPAGNGFLRNRTITLPGEESELEQFQLSMVHALDENHLTDA